MRQIAVPASLFFTNAVLYISLFSRFPEVTATLGLTSADLGRALLGLTAGTILGFPLAGRVIRWLGLRRVCGLSTLGIIVLLPLAAIGGPSGGFWGLALSLAGYGFTCAIFEVAKNLIAARIEKETGRAVLARSHGFWSMGLLFGTLACALAAHFGLSAPMQLCILGALFAPLGIALLVQARPMAEVASAPPALPLALGAPRRRFLPDSFVLLLLLLVVGFSVTEGAVYDWSMFYVKEDLAVPAAAASMIYAAFTLGMIAARMGGDRLRERLALRQILPAMALVVLVGLAVLALSAWLPPAAMAFGLAAGFALRGLGVALAAPIAVGVAMTHPTRPPEQTMATYAVASLVATFGVPPLLGVIVHDHGAIWALSIMVPLLAFVALAAPSILRRMAAGDNAHAPG